ncbi:MAG: hypothetical protein K0S80_2873, partial [Neobacillus sp.]|nr:hypothetical protein [Neobacillus sp.]
LRNLAIRKDWVQLVIQTRYTRFGELYFKIGSIPTLLIGLIGVKFRKFINNFNLPIGHPKAPIRIPRKGAFFIS